MFIFIPGCRKPLNSLFFKTKYVKRERENLYFYWQTFSVDNLKHNVNVITTNKNKTNMITLC